MMKVRELLHELSQQGWNTARIKGSHRQLRHQYIPGTVTVPGHLGRDLPLGTFKAIQRQTQGFSTSLRHQLCKPQSHQPRY